MKQVNEDKNDKTVPILLIEKCSDGDDYKSRVLFSGKNSEEIEDCFYRGAQSDARILDIVREVHYRLENGNVKMSLPEKVMVNILHFLRTCLLSI